MKLSFTGRKSSRDWDCGFSRAIIKRTSNQITRYFPFYDLIADHPLKFIVPFPHILCESELVYILKKKVEISHNLKILINILWIWVSSFFSRLELYKRNYKGKPAKPSKYLSTILCLTLSPCFVKTFLGCCRKNQIKSPISPLTMKRLFDDNKQGKEQIGWSIEKKHVKLTD